jgi:formate hydrogenlyase subunit 6/NADH:ubiquinone oxidoreductase subunit I
MTYFSDIKTGIRTTLKGLSLTLRHLRHATKRRTPEGIASENYFDQQNGLVTLQYPHEQLPIPDNGRYRLRNEIDDCIVCDKCAKVCPVDCITIDAIKATEEVGRASDGSPIRLYAGKFDIDMAKCCYCGLCTVVCPTECLTMDKKFDYSEFELGELTYHFSNLTSEQADEKRSLYEQFLREKEGAKRNVTAKSTSSETSPVTKPAPARPAFRPTAKPVAKTPPADTKPENSEGSSIEHPLTDATPDEMQQIAQGGLEMTKKPVFTPTRKPVVHPTDLPEAKQPVEQKPTDETSKVVEQKKPVFRPTQKPKTAVSPDSPESESLSESAPEQEPQKPATKPTGFRPTMKPPTPKPAEQPSGETPESTPKPTTFRPTMKPAKSADDQPPKEPEATTPSEVLPEKPKPAGFRPTMKPAKATTVPKTEEVPIEPKQETTSPETSSEKPISSATEPPKPKPAGFRPTMKPVKPASAPKNEEVPVEVKPEATSPDIIDEAVNLPVEEPPKPAAKPVGFRPTMKPKPKPDEN